MYSFDSFLDQVGFIPVFSKKIFTLQNFGLLLMIGCVDQRVFVYLNLPCVFLFKHRFYLTNEKTMVFHNNYSINNKT